jgi:hypothetical protein
VTFPTLMMISRIKIKGIEVIVAVVQITKSVILLEVILMTPLLMEAVKMTKKNFTSRLFRLSLRKEIKMLELMI